MYKTKSIETLSVGTPKAWGKDTVSLVDKMGPLTFNDLYGLPYFSDEADGVKRTLDSIRQCDENSPCLHAACTNCGERDGRLHRTVFEKLLHESGLLASPFLRLTTEVTISYDGLCKLRVLSDESMNEILNSTAIALVNAHGHINTDSIIVALNPLKPTIDNVTMQCLIVHHYYMDASSSSEIEARIRKSMADGIVQHHRILQPQVNIGVSVKKLEENDCPVVRLYEITATPRAETLWRQILDGDEITCATVLAHNFHLNGMRIFHCTHRLGSDRDVLVPVRVDLGPKDEA